MKETTFHLRDHLLFALLTVLTLILCIGVGSVSVPFRDTAEIIFRAIAGWEQPSGSAVAIVTPADGPSFGTAPSGTWMWISTSL